MVGTIGDDLAHAALNLYFWPTPNGRKITIMLEELEVPYRLTYVNIRRDEQFAPDFLRIAPNNKVPALVDADGPGGQAISIFESGAILQYLGRKFNRFYGEDERQRVRVDEWLFWQGAGLGPMAGQANHFRNTVSEHVPYAIERFSGEVRRLYQVLEKQLSNIEYIAGPYSIVDMACFPWVVQHKNAGIDLSDFPSVGKWVSRMSIRPAVERALLVGKEERRRQKRELRSQG
ncbi:glutathione S-transferase N-terminal domain-containing protein [Rhizobium grahamii]|uniref:Glutathione S-transferase n=1 Tax=Rhizobium grahamii TaxID=1120045 RepID=A0A370KEH7_9HYPH|nr:glutathione S-transferase N-terminal domain-containing protein [Rhizobium grahamii]RDJ02298.1 glutathione S-transferase [Rhizobium grahamii]